MVSQQCGEAVLEVPHRNTDPFLLPMSKPTCEWGWKTPRKEAGQRRAMPVQAGGKLQAGLACIYPCAGLGMQERFRGTGAGGLVPAGTEQNTPRFFCHLRVGVGRSGIFPLCPLQIYFSGVSLRPSNGTCLHPLPAHPAEPRHPACPPPVPSAAPGEGDTPVLPALLAGGCGLG